jgi:hypothetical protein
MYNLISYPPPKVNSNQGLSQQLHNTDGKKREAVQEPSLGTVFQLTFPPSVMHLDAIKSHILRKQ